MRRTRNGTRSVTPMNACRSASKVHGVERRAVAGDRQAARRLSRARPRTDLARVAVDLGDRPLRVQRGVQEPAVRRHSQVPRAVPDPVDRRDREVVEIDDRDVRRAHDSDVCRGRRRADGDAPRVRTEVGAPDLPPEVGIDDAQVEGAIGSAEWPASTLTCSSGPPAASGTRGAQPTSSGSSTSPTARRTALSDRTTPLRGHADAHTGPPRHPRLHGVVDTPQRRLRGLQDGATP